MYYNYGIETDDNIMSIMSVSVSDIVAKIEFEILNLLISEYFAFCDHKIFPGRNRRRIVMSQKSSDMTDGKTIDHGQRLLSQLIGLSSKPIDVANGGKLLCKSFNVKQKVFFILMKHQQ